ncbi:MAG: TonB-dependent receptor [Dysgonomonas sp.]|nr:TonB-dependent receptor [Dysgonomonas sp.]
MFKKKQVFNFSSRRWRIPLCAVAFSLLPTLYSASYNEVNASNSVLSANEVQQQKRTIKGLVVDNTGEPVIGATVKEKGTMNATMTDVSGEFTLSIAQGSVLEVSFVGYITQSVTVSGSDNVRVELKEDQHILDEVVVTGFGLSQKKATLTGAITTLGAEDISRSSASTVSSALTGKIAGVNTRQTDGRPGSGTQISIRNMGNPLYVIDGVQSDGEQFNNLDFNDIENITVLKDASASIYGVRAANGVVVVTTKRGKTNTKNTVSLNAYYGWQDNFKFADPADSKSYVRNYAQAETLKLLEKSDYQRRYSKEEYDKFMEGKEVGYQGFDWYDYIWNSAPQYYVNVNVSGGSDKTSYYVSLGHLDQAATIKSYGGFKRTNAQMNIDTQINERLKIGATLNGRIESRRNPGVPGGDDLWLPRFAVLRNLPTMRPYANDNPNYPQKAGDDTQTNFAVLNYGDSGYRKEDWRVIQLQGNVEYEIVKGLKAKGLGSYYFANRVDDIQEYIYSLYRYDKATDTYPVDYTADNPYRERVTAHVEEISTNIQLNYEGKFGGHSVNAVAGWETIRRRNPETKLFSQPYSDEIKQIYYPDMNRNEDYGNRTETRVGWVGRVNYDYENKYLLEASGRYDGSWKFPKNDRWGFFPSASLGWRISEENFWQESKLPNIFSDLKFRISYGLAGDDDLGDNYKAFDYMGGYTYNEGGSVMDGEYILGTKMRKPAVENISWIKAKFFDVGFDASFLNNRLVAQFDYFNRKRTGLPASRYDVLIAKEVGFDLPKENLNSDVHRGVDGAIKWTDKINDLHYSIGGNATYARFYDWFQYDGHLRSNSWDVYRNSIDKRFGYINWGLQSDGQFQSWEEIANYPIDNDRKGNTTLRPGDIKYKDLNGDGVINGMDERPIGFRQDATPVLNFGLNFAFAWKGIDLAFDFSGSAFQTYYQRWEQQIPFQNNGNNPKFLFNDSWHLEDPWDANSKEISGKYPMVRLDMGSHSNYWNSDFWKQNVTYMKLRNLELGYTIPRNYLEKLNISSLRLYVSGTNLFALTNVRGVDPEQQDENGLGYPTMRMFNFGVNLKF